MTSERFLYGAIWWESGIGRIDEVFIAQNIAAKDDGSDDER